MGYEVILKSLKNEDEVIVLSEASTAENAQEARRSWRRILGGKSWTVDRRPGLDTLDHLAIVIRTVKTG
jgi:hypothetical protein